jgi:hypothetical protein
VGELGSRLPAETFIARAREQQADVIDADDCTAILVAACDREFGGRRDDALCLRKR